MRISSPWIIWLQIVLAMLLGYSLVLVFAGSLAGAWFSALGFGPPQRVGTASSGSASRGIRMGAVGPDQLAGGLVRSRHGDVARSGIPPARAVQRSLRPRAGDSADQTSFALSASAAPIRAIAFT